MTTGSVPSWKDPQLTAYMRQHWRAAPTTTAPERTHAIAACFLRALGDPALAEFQPDMLWTALQNVYYLEQAQPALQIYQTTGSALVLIEALNAVRNGWVKSSGTAFQDAVAELYTPMLLTQTPRAALAVKRRADLHQNCPLGRRPENLDDPTLNLGSNDEDDLYLLTEDDRSRVWIFGAASLKASGGDRYLQWVPRSRELMQAGLFSCGFTLDPRQVPRSPKGHLRPGASRALKNVAAMNRPDASGQFALHRVFVGREENGRMDCPFCADHPSRIYYTRMRSLPDAFIDEVVKARNAWLQSGQRLPIDWNGAG